MSKDSLLKKEFKHSDVQRVRNIVNKDFTGKTKIQSGYKKSFELHEEGEVWEESGKTWTIKNGIKQNITKLDKAKKAVRIPLTCPKCGGSMKHHLQKKMYKIHGFCFDPCTIKMESDLIKAGLYKDYQKRMMSGNLKAFAQDIEAWALETLTTSDNFVTEDGTVETWGGMSNENKAKILDSIKDYVKYIRQKA
jgi:hypothetical protein